MDIRRVRVAEAPAFQALRLKALAEYPADFGSDHATAAGRPLSFFVSALIDNHVMGAFDSGALVGIVGIQFLQNIKERHRAYIFGVYARGRGVARPLMLAALREAFTRVTQVELNVRVGNTAAERLYQGLGFVTCGGIPGIHQVDGVLYDDSTMVLTRARYLAMLSGAWVSNV